MAYLGNNNLPFDPTKTVAAPRDADRFSGNASTVTFTLSRSVQKAVDLEVYVENVRQEPITAYDVNGTSLTFTGAPPSGTNNVYVVYRNFDSGAQAYVPDGSVSYNKLANNLRLFTTDNLTPNGNNTVFTLSEPPADANTVMVTIDGVLQRAPVHYTTSGSTITFTSSPPAGSNVHVRHLGFRTSTSVTAIPVGTYIPQPNIATPTIRGTTVITDDSAGVALRITQTGSGNALVVEDAANPDSTPFVVSNTGNIGIGTSSPLRSLDINGGIALSVSGGGGRAINFLDSDTNIAPVLMNGYSGSAGPYLTFETNTFGNAATERMRIDSNGNVGIGTISPGTKVEVFTGSTLEGLRIRRYAGAYYSDIVHTDTPEGLAFKVGDGSTVSERMRIAGNGNLMFNSGYGSVATAYGCRAWVNFNGTGTVAIRASGNVSSITDNGTGDYTVNFSTAMPDANYAVSATGCSVAGSVNTGWDAAVYDQTSFSTSSIRIKVANSSGTTYYDTNALSIGILR